MCVYIKILMMGFIKVISFTGNSLNSFFTRFILILFLLIIIVLLHFRWLFNFLAVFRFLHVHRFEFCLFCPSPRLTVATSSVIRPALLLPMGYFMLLLLWPSALSKWPDHPLTSTFCMCAHV